MSDNLFLMPQILNRRGTKYRQFGRKGGDLLSHDAVHSRWGVKNVGCIFQKYVQEMFR